jgi:transposase-like protein
MPRRGRAWGGRALRQQTAPPNSLTAEQRLLLVDTWLRSGLTTAEFAALVGLSNHTLYNWKRKFQAEGLAGLVDRPPGGPPGRMGSENRVGRSAQAALSRAALARALVGADILTSTSRRAVAPLGG